MTSRRLSACLLALAVLNLTVGVWLSFAKGSFSDLLTVAGWAGAWMGGGNPYGAGSATDYPPWALVELAPLAFVPASWLPVLWIALNLALAAAIARMLASASLEPHDIVRQILLLIAATACLRTLAQFSHLSYALALAGGLLSFPVAGGLLLGLSLMKPQIGGVVVLWLVTRRDWRRVAVALSVPLVLTLVFCLSVAVNPLQLIADYLLILGTIHEVPTVLPGHSDLRYWLWSAWPSVAGNLVLSAAVVGVLIAPLFIAGRPAEPPGRDFERLALCGAISLLSVRHLSYDFILLLPVLIAWRTRPFALRDHAPRWLFAGIATLLVAAIPSWARLAVDRGAPESLALLTELDRMMCLTVWGVLTWRLCRPSAALTPARSAVL